MNHSDIESLLGAYALDAVDRSEADLVELHLTECPRCRAEVAAHRDTASMLASVGSDAPAEAWDAIAAKLDAAPPPLRLGRLDARSAIRSRARSAALAALGAAAALAVISLGLKVQHVDHQLAALRGPIQAQGIERAALAATTDPTARHVVLRGDHSRDEADIVVLPSGQSYLLRANLPALPTSKTYQLWGVVDGHTKVSLGLLGARPAVAAFRVDSRAVSLLAITAEPAAGVATTDMAAIVWAPIT